ncbi:hypothetical protein AeRB84_007647 [Aphanomyces euteiches]|nr:hypothetical protein AeRB84_007647 [Aphanomyces euteiches]
MLFQLVRSMLRIRSVLVDCLTAVVLANDGNQTTVEGGTFISTSPSLTGSLNHLSETIFGRETELQETVELLHMMLFLFVVIFLCLCMCAKVRVGHVVDACCRVFLKWGERVQGEFREFERRAPYLSVVLTDYALALESSTNWRNRWSIKRMRNLKKREREMVYISLRRRFVDYRSNHPDPAKAKAIAHAFQLEPETRFPFNEYLNIISGEVLARLIEIDPITWIALEILVVALLFLCWAVGPENEVFVLLISGGVLVANTIAVHAGIHNMRVLLMSPGLFAAAQQRLKELSSHSRVLSAISPDMTTDQIQSIVHVLDEHHTGEITFEDFYHWCSTRIEEYSTKSSKDQLIKEVFDMIDTDGSGSITVDEFVAIFKTLGQSLNHDDVRELVYQMDCNNDGKIDLDEFEKMLQKHSV